MRYHSILRTLLAGSALVALSSAAVAQEETKLDLITVIIGKVKQSLQDAVGGVSVATRKDLEQHGSSSVSDVLAPMPGVSTEENANDPAQAVNVRGLQDFGRVAVTIDGARQNFQRTGHNADGMFYFEPEMMQQVTVTRGPVANVYGSGAIGGVVSFETIDSLSFLKEGKTSPCRKGSATAPMVTASCRAPPGRYALANSAGCLAVSSTVIPMTTKMVMEIPSPTATAKSRRGL